MGVYIAVGMALLFGLFFVGIDNNARLEACQRDKSLEVCQYIISR
jgi:hypothetical protein